MSLELRFLHKGRTFARETLERQLRATLPRLRAARVLDLGSKRSPYRGWIRCERYESVDVLCSNQPNIVGDAHCLPIRDCSYDAVIATQVLEHCYSPELAAREVHRILKPSGVFVVSVPFIYVIHADPHDFWRFTEYSLRHVLRPFDEVEICSLGNRITCVWDFVSGQITTLRYLNRFLLPLWFLSRPNRRCPHGYVAVARKRRCPSVTYE